MKALEHSLSFDLTTEMEYGEDSSQDLVSDTHYSVFRIYAHTKACKISCVCFDLIPLTWRTVTHGHLQILWGISA